LIMRRSVLAAAALALTLSACESSDPVARQADTIKDGADARADAIRSDARKLAEGLDNRADALADAADKAGGYKEQVLDTRAEALKRESRIVMQQGRAEGDAIETRGEAEAKALRAQ